MPIEYIALARHRVAKRDSYSMKSIPHGVALIIVNTKYPKKDRKGAKNDCINLEKVFKLLKYKVIVCEDLSKREIEDVVTRIANEDHTQFDSFVCCISSKGCNNHYIIDKSAHRKYIDVYKLVDIIQRCPTLQGKPKLFFFIFNRIKRSKGPSPIASTIKPDTLIVWSDQKGKEISDSDNHSGSNFPIALRRFIELKLKSSKIDLCSLLLEVSASLSLIPPKYSHLSYKYESHCCEIETTLRFTISYDVQGICYVFTTCIFIQSFI